MDEIQLAQSAAAIIRDLPQAIIMLDQELTILGLNPAAHEFLAAGRVTLFKIGWRELFPSSSELANLPLKAQKEENSIVLRDLLLEEEKLTPIRLDAWVGWQGKTEPLIISLHFHRPTSVLEGTEIERAWRPQRIALMDVLAHEVKNPLAGIRGAAQLISQSSDADNAAQAVANYHESDKELLHLIIREADRISKLIDRLRNFGAAGEPNFAGFNLHAWLDHALLIAQSGFAKGSEILFQRDYDPSLPEALGDVDQLTQVILNLIKNAHEALSESSLDTKSAAKPMIRLKTAWVGGRKPRPRMGNLKAVNLPLMISIEDNGPGIDPDLSPRLFQPFATSHTAGRGIGLALVAKIVHDHDGLIEVSREEGWTCFRLFLPRA